MNGKTLRSLRQKAGLTQLQLANRTGRSQANISQAESGVIGVPSDVEKAALKLKADPKRSAKLLSKAGAMPRKKRKGEKKGSRGKVVRIKKAAPKAAKTKAPIKKAPKPKATKKRAAKRPAKAKKPKAPKIPVAIPTETPEKAAE